MNKISKAGSIKSIQVVLGLVFLLLVSPCKVRNFIQAELGILQTKVLNKSKSTFSQSNCRTLAFSETLEVNSRPVFPKSKLPNLQVYHFNIEVHLPQYLLNPSSSKSPLIFDAPLFILYQKLQVYS